MKLKRLTLRNNYRLMLGGTRSIVLEPENVIQLILGTNGSGKSSLLREVFPFPAESKDYDEGGFKEAIYEHRGSEYIVTSTMKPQKHSFLKDGVELNQGGTQKIQTELVRQEFGLTTAIRDLMIGNTRFHSMSPLARRELFVQMSDVDFTFGLSFFNKLRDRLRDTTGALKLSKSRLAIEAAKVISKEEREKYQARVESLHSRISELIDFRSPITTPSAVFESRLKDYLGQLSVTAAEVLECDLEAHKRFGAFTSIEDIGERIVSLREHIRLEDERAAALLKDHQKATEDVRLLKSAGGASVQELRAQVQGFDGQIKTILNSMARPWGLESPDAARQALEGVEEELVDIFSNIEQNDDGRFTSTAFKELRASLDQDKITAEKRDRDLRELLSRKEHHEHHRKAGEVNCPQCGYGWVMGFSQETYDLILTGIENTSNELKTLRERIESAAEDVERTSQYFATFKRYIALKDRWTVLRPLWDAMDDNGLSYKYPKMVFDLIESFKKDLSKYKEIGAIEKERERVTLVLSALEQADLAEARRSEERIDRIAEELEHATQAQRFRYQELRDIQNYHSRMQSARKLRNHIVEILTKANQDWRGFVDTLRMEDVHTILKSLQSELAMTEDVLSQITVQEALIADLELNIAQLTNDEQAVKLLIKELSPTEGLIAEGLMGYINSVTSQMNLIISSIWTYDIEILPCSISEESGADLDYRFPIQISDIPRPIPDILMGSVGQRDVVDLSFVLVFLERLGLVDIPLFLDEFGSGFDVAHRVASMETIRDMVNQLKFPQVFMVSHYHDSYGALSNVDITVLCTDNVVLPHEFNTHAKIN